MAITIYRADDPPASYIKLYSGNWLLKAPTGVSFLYSTDQGTNWFRCDDESGKIEVINSYLYVEDVTGCWVWQLAQKAVAVIES